MGNSAVDANHGGPSHGPYLALIGDIRGSRESPDRVQLQRRFETAVDAGWHEVGRGSAATRFTITLGDEFQGLLLDAGAVLAAMHTIASEMGPHRMAFGIGYGRLDTPIPSPSDPTDHPPALGIDGPCLHHARDALEAAKTQGTWASVRGLGERTASQLDPLLALVGAVREGWTNRQLEFIREMRIGNGVQKAVAQALDVAPSVVSESLSAARYQEVRAAHAAISDLLQERVDDHDGPPVAGEGG